MPRVNTARASRDYPEAGIKKGDTYYHWKFRHSPKQMSKTPPRPSQLTMSKLSAAYSAQETMQDTLAGVEDIEDIAQAARDCAEAVREVAQEYRDSRENMPTPLQDGQVGQECEEKADALEAYADELESAADEVEGLDPGDYFNEDDHRAELLAEVAAEGKFEDDDARQQQEAEVRLNERKEHFTIGDLLDDEREAMFDAARELVESPSLDL